MIDRLKKRRWWQAPQGHSHVPIWDGGILRVLGVGSSPPISRIVTDCYGGCEGR